MVVIITAHLRSCTSSCLRLLLRGSAQPPHAATGRDAPGQQASRVPERPGTRPLPAWSRRRRSAPCSGATSPVRGRPRAARSACPVLGSRGGRRSRPSSFGLVALGVLSLPRGPTPLLLARRLAEDAGHAPSRAHPAAPCGHLGARGTECVARVAGGRITLAHAVIVGVIVHDSRCTSAAPGDPEGTTLRDHQGPGDERARGQDMPALTARRGQLLPTGAGRRTTVGRRQRVTAGRRGGAGRNGPTRSRGPARRGLLLLGLRMILPA